MSTFRTLRPVVLPHLAVLPPALAWRLAAGWAPSAPFEWLPAALFFVTVVTAAAAWRRSGLALGRPLVGYSWVRGGLSAVGAALRACYDYFTLLVPVPPPDEKRCEAGQFWFGALVVVPLILGALYLLAAVGPALLLALQLLAAAPAALSSPWLSALAILLADLLALAVAIRRTRPAVPAASEPAAPAADPAGTALQTVRDFYEGHRDLVEADYPQARLDAELSVRVPPGTGAADAWKEARELIRDLQKLIQAARTRRGRPAVNPPPASRPPDLSNI